MAIRTPAEVFPPGDFLREELEERGWTQGDLAEILGRDVTLVNQIVQGKRSITPETARGLAAAFGTSPEFWMRLEQAYQLWCVRDKDDDAVQRRAKLYSYAPIADMVRRGWIEPSENIDVFEKRVMMFYRVRSFDPAESQLAYAARKSTSYEDVATPSQKAWLARAYNLAHGVQVAPFSANSVSVAAESLKRLLHAPEETRHVPRILSDVGIRFVIVQPLSGSKIDGACFKIGDAPVIALSLRYDRIDYFWFTLLHELGHCNQGEASLDTEDMSPAHDGKPESERKADEFARNNLIKQSDLDSFIARKRPLYSTNTVEAFARTKGVHPGIVLGQLQHRGELKWGVFRKMLVPIRDHINASALTDGWGHVISE